jgi:hypothetical protein
VPAKLKCLSVTDCKANISAFYQTLKSQESFTDLPQYLIDQHELIMQGDKQAIYGILGFLCRTCPTNKNSPAIRQIEDSKKTKNDRVCTSNPNLALKTHRNDHQNCNKLA